MKETAKKKFKFEITQNDDGDYDYLGNGGDVLDYLATLSETFVQLCKDNQLPAYPLIKGMFKEQLSEYESDKLEEYLVTYDEESIQKIRDKKMQLVTASEFFGLHQEKLAAERKVEAFEKHSDELLEKNLLESGCAALLVHQDNEQNIIIEKLDYQPVSLISKRDLAILTAYTGNLFGKFQDFQGYAEEILGQPFFTHQFGEKGIFEKLHERSKQDFLELHDRLIRESEGKDD